MLVHCSCNLLEVSIIMSRSKWNDTISIGLYNVENLFDTVKDPYTKDDEFTPKGSRNWNKKKYYHKLRKISRVLSMLGKEASHQPAALIGLVEVENERVLADLVRQKNLLASNYGFIHFESADVRGIDVALLYQRDAFQVLQAEAVPKDITTPEGEVVRTRDILVVKGILEGDLINVIVTHWPSRREGVEASEYKRMAAANSVREVIEELRATDKVPAKFIVMGDFNDDPADKSLQALLCDDFYNVTAPLHTPDQGSLVHDKAWHLFDQIIISRNFFDEDSSLSFERAQLFIKPWLQVYHGKLKGSPYRTFIGPWYEGGYSDHFPVLAHFKKKKASR